MDRNQFDTKDGRDNFVRDTLEKNPSFDRSDFGQLVKEQHPGKDKATRDLVSNLLNAYYQVTTRDKLDTEDGRDEFVMHTLRNRNYGRGNFQELVTRRNWSGQDQGDLVSNLMDAYDKVTTREQLDTEEARDAFVIIKTLRDNNFGREEQREFAYAHRSLQRYHNRMSRREKKGKAAEDEDA